MAPRTVLTATLLLMLAVLPLAAQERPDFSAAVKEKMAPLLWLRGDWTGTATMTMGPNTTEIDMIERVEFELDDMILTFEGIGTVDGETGHHAFATITYDVQQEKYVMSSMTKEGMIGRPDVTLEDGVLTWVLETPMGTMRYRIHQDEDGRWQEVGHFSRDGETWNPFFSMTLEKDEG